MAEPQTQIHLVECGNFFWKYKTLFLCEIAWPERGASPVPTPPCMLHHFVNQFHNFQKKITEKGWTLYKPQIERCSWGNVMEWIDWWSICFLTCLGTKTWKEIPPKSQPPREQQITSQWHRKLQKHQTWDLERDSNLHKFDLWIIFLKMEVKI